MARRCTGGREHRGKIVKDPAIETPCSTGEVWTTKGVIEAWLCAHMRICVGCKKVLAEEVSCPLNYHNLPQHRRRA